ncbi:MAG: hypothetical protein WBM75_09945 [Polyangiales bacterium]
MTEATVRKLAQLVLCIASLSTTASAQGWESIPLDAIKPSKDLWLYGIGEDHERHYCGTKARAKGREVLELLRTEFSMSEASCGPSEKEGLISCGGGYGSEWIGLEIRPDADGTYELRMAFRQDPSVLWPSIRVEQRLFLDRSYARSCREFGPETVWHPPRNDRFIRRTLARVSKLDASVLPRELFYYDEHGGDDLPAEGPRMVESDTRHAEAWWDELGLMFGATAGDGPCRPCGRQQQRCIECWVSGSCSAQVFVRFAPDSTGVVRVRAKLILDTHPTDFGYAPYLPEMIELLDLRRD